jgi:hypothetical protein
VPYTTNSKYKRCNTVDDVINKTLSLRRKYVGAIPYVFVQACLCNNLEYKIVCFNGEALYHASIGTCSKGNATRRAYSDFETIHMFAEHAINRLKTVCQDCIVDGLVRVDIFWCSYLDRLVVNEFES